MNWGGILIENIFKELISKIEEYKYKTGKTYTEIADDIGITKYSFANLRRDWRNDCGFPRKETIKKLRKIIEI